MKNYAYSIFLMCGLTYFAIQVQGDCQFGSEVLKVGVKTIPPCSGIVCEPTGEIYTVKCAQPKRHVCRADEEPLGHLYEDPTKPYPHCCPATICVPRRDIYGY
ncbi:uncharacterized protein LOC105840979 [Monomorium pharaonis]|uniref:uncharacterized protein LOC105840979 n=1 Tax=Monomorium pharaonis TaxID=307658 RepID=UPI00063F1E41|nr:uncharacterized protein LOC105840979 [Monomorium pharaonis]